MQHRTHLSPQDRAARSALTKILQTNPILRGSIVRMARTCGKPNCRCYRGHKHVSFYLATRVGKKRKMIYIPQPLEETVRSWVDAHKEVERLLNAISQAAVERFLTQKKKAEKPQPPKKRRRIHKT